jgi:hypothetical protein
MFYESHVVNPATSLEGLGDTVVVSSVHTFEYIVIRSLLHFYQTTLRESQNNALRTTYHPLLLSPA